MNSDLETPSCFAIDSQSGAFECLGFAPVPPLMRHSDFAASALASTCRLVDQRGSHSRYTLPKMTIADAELLAEAEFNHWKLRGLWLRPTFADDAGARGRSRSEADGVARQEAWLRRHIGISSGEYPWGRVWNRLNINADWFDISITYALTG